MLTSSLTLRNQKQQFSTNVCNRMVAQKNRNDSVIELSVTKLDQMNGFALDFGKRSFFVLS